MPNHAIGNFCWFVSDLMRMAKNKTREEEIISHSYKYQ